LATQPSLEAHEQQFVYERLQQDTAVDINTALINEALKTEASLAIIPLQDFLKLDTHSRMNTPGIADGNWEWRFEWTELPDNLGADISAMITANQRQGEKTI